jgi:hypothetical protein
VKAGPCVHPSAAVTRSQLPDSLVMCQQQCKCRKPTLHHDTMAWQPPQVGLHHQVDLNPDRPQQTDSCPIHATIAAGLVMWLLPPAPQTLCNAVVTSHRVLQLVGCTKQRRDPQETYAASASTGSCWHLCTVRPPADPATLWWWTGCLITLLMIMRQSSPCWCRR